MLIDSVGNLKLSDFGTAKLQGAIGDMTFGGMSMSSGDSLKGTRHYLSPEIMDAFESGQRDLPYSYASDIW